jgi:hypothetical protein
MDTKKQNQRQKTKTAEMQFLGNVEISNRNTEIRNEINIFNLNNRIHNSRLNWIHHDERIEPHLIPKQLMDCTPRGERCIGLYT